jgi:hypothetical protein
VKYIDEKLLYFVHLLISCAVYFFDRNMLLIFDVENLMPLLVNNFQEGSNLSVFITLCIMALCVQLADLIVNKIYFLPKILDGGIKVLWARLFGYTFFTVFVGVFGVVSFLMKIDKVVDAFFYFMVALTMAYGVVGLFFYFSRFVFIKRV